MVDYLRSVVHAIGISAGAVIDLPSGRKAQGAKVDYYIRNCTIPLVLLTFDEEHKGTSNARPNVYDEIARCSHLGKKRDTIILQQSEGKRVAQLPSNVTGQMVVIQFDEKKRYDLVPPLLRELWTRQLPRSMSAEQRTVEAGGLLSEFLDKMDGIWEGEFDQAWRKIHRLDYSAESNFADMLDLFFQQYHKVLVALVRDRKRGSELKIVCDISFTEALNCAARAWEYVAESRMKAADEHSAKPALKQAHRKYRRLYDQGADVLRQGKSVRQPESQIGHFRKAIELLDDYMDKT